MSRTNIILIEFWLNALQQNIKYESIFVFKYKILIEGVASSDSNRHKSILHEYLGMISSNLDKW